MAEPVRNFTVWEAVLHAFLNSFPYMVLALYSFRDHWRFGKKTTISVLAAAIILQMILVPISLFSGKQAFFDIVLSVIHVAFFFSVVKDHIGKLIFSVLVLTNLGTLVVVCAKCLEGIFFPELALLKYHYTNQIFTVIMLIIIVPIVYFFIFKDMSSPASDTDDGSENADVSGYMWHYLWLIPAVFYLIWMFVSYSGGHSITENRMNPVNALYLTLIDAGSVLIYRIIIKTVQLYEKNASLQAENHILSIQRMQYNSLNERLENMRRTRHDLRHHAALLKQIRDNNDFDALDELINTYTEKNLLNQPLVCCENETVNVVLALYSETAYNNNISFSIKANIPDDIFVSKEDLSVMFGNILENATDACKEVEGDRFINLNTTYKTTANGTPSLTLIVKNNYGTEPSESDDGIFHSTKHAGDGIGISSVKRTAKKYDGACTFTHEDGTFTVSVVLYGPAEKKS